jgi:type I restriction enzyme S subunit
VSAIESIASGSTFKEVSGSVLKDFKLDLPSLPTQKKIAHILSTLDDKIELNRKINQTLEAMAQALFKSWFVDFDPVHVKLTCKSDEELEVAARELGISKEVLELFPNEFEESELGMIPKGWEVKPLDEIANYQNGLALQKFRPKNENEYLPVLKIAQLSKGFADGEEKADVNIKPECIVDSGDIVFSWSGTLMVDIWCGGKAALNQHLFKVTSNNYPKWFYYYWTKQHLFNFQHIAASKAVTMGHIKKGHLSEALCVIPNDELFNLVDRTMKNFVEKIILCRLEDITLQKTRDTLLPKLLSGELDVSELELDMD